MLHFEPKQQDYQKEFADYIKLVGKGQRASQYLTQPQAYRAMSLLLQNLPSPEQQGAFLMLLRMREESAEELAGFVAACRAALPCQQLKGLSIDLDMGCYAGKRRHLPWFVLAVILMAQQGLKIFMHGTAEPESQRLYLHQVWQSFNWPMAKNEAQAAQLINLFGFCYMDLAKLHPAMQQKIQLRSLFGLRSCFNSLARMLNPSGAQVSLQGVFHREFDQKHTDVAALLGDNIACFRGEGGEVEANPERAFDLHLHNASGSQIVTFPEMLYKRQIKPRELNPNMLADVWTGKLVDNYAEQAVITSVALMLTALKSLPTQEALHTAKTLWLTRDKHWPNYGGAFI